MVRKAGEVTCLRPTLLAGTQKRRKGYRLRDPPWGSRSNHILGTLALGSDTKKVSSLSMFENQFENKWDQYEGCKKWRLLLKNICTCLLTPGTEPRQHIESLCSSDLFAETTPMHIPAYTGHQLQPLMLLSSGMETAGARERTYT